MIDDRCTLILIEDSEDDALILQEVIAGENIHLAVKHFVDGKSAYQYLLQLTDKNRVYHTFVVLDLNLPSMNGKQILQKLSERNTPSTLPVIVFSGSENPSDKQECLQYGANAYYVKPWEYDGYIDFVRGPLLQQLKQVCPLV